MGFFDDLRAALGVGGPTELEDRTSEDRQGVSNVRPKARRTTIGEQFDIAKGDVAYGLGISKDKPYGYDERTAQSQRMAKVQQERMEAAGFGKEDRPKGARPAEAPDADTADGASEAAVPGADEPLKGAAPEGRTEAGAMTAGKKGRKGTILTGPQGLLADPDTTRPRRSLMGLIK
jgi:hypothetical protein